MNIQQMLSVLDADIVERLKTAVEIGKWPNGIALTAEQRQTCMQAVIAWEHEHVDATQRTGYINKPKKDQTEACDDEHHVPENEFTPIRFV
ncbi:hypothetical protein EC844_109105 [Acinetobacter calcoaceticus]|uniref:DUF1315 family protein n=1 Tax=Acinetobacter calcoaceticus TaxID=471 RepID=A0A4R1Y5F2_ACICA|nr:hypothetical protein EC844_109105 [Acinetobacter calcoaceticus]